VSDPELSAPVDPDLTGLLLCGGRSRRMGRDKATLELAGRSLIERALDVLDAVAPATLLATGSEPRHAELGRPLVQDEVEGAGPLAGLAAGLAAARTRWVACLPCDAPRVNARLVRALLERARMLGLDVAALASARGLEPAIAVVDRRVRPAVEASLRRADRRLVAYWRDSVEGRPLVARGFRPAELGLPQLEALDPARNVNTPDELEAERRAWTEEVTA